MINGINNNTIVQQNNLNPANRNIPDETIDDTNTNSPQKPDNKPTISSSDVLDELESKASPSNGESFEDVINEMRKNVPDQTTTREEKELAIKYICRMLACDDIPNDAKTFWNNQKFVIEEEMKHCMPKEADDIAKEWRAFADANWNNGNFPSREAAIEYYETYIDYMDKILDCDNVPEEMQQEFQRMKENATRDLNNIKAEEGLDNSYKTVEKELNSYFPNLKHISTIAGKRLAISYINRMFKCEDLPSDLKTEYKATLENLENEIKEQRQKSKFLFL